MGSLQDQLLKAGLVDKKKIKKVKHEKRIIRKSEDVKTRDKQKAEKEQEWLKRQEELKLEQQQLAQEKRRKELESEKKHNLRDLILSAAKGINWSGKRRFYFVTRANTISYLNVSDPIERKLEKGEMAIVEHPEKKTDDYIIVSINVALKLVKERPDMVRFMNKKYHTGG